MLLHTAGPMRTMAEELHKGIRMRQCRGPSAGENDRPSPQQADPHPDYKEGARMQQPFREPFLVEKVFFFCIAALCARACV